MKSGLKNVLVLLTVLLLSYFCSTFFGKLYDAVFPSITGSYIDFTSLVGLPLSYIFFITTIFTAFGDNKKHWWITISLIPAILFEAAFDSRHLYFPIAIGLVGWLLGRGVNMLVQKINNKKVIVK